MVPSVIAVDRLMGIMAIGLATIVCCRTRIAGCSACAISCSIEWGMGTMGLVSVLGLGLGS